jgi:tetratricopeptide (TPR) repeat protein
MQRIFGWLTASVATAVLLASTCATAAAQNLTPDGARASPDTPADLSPAEQACRWGATVDERIKGCTALIKEEPDAHVRAEAFGLRGNALASKGNYDRAVADFDAANQLWPEFGGPYLDRASARMERGDFRGAIADYSRLIHVDPVDSAGFDGRCWARGMANIDLDAALSDCNRAIQISPRDALPYEDRAIVWLRKHASDRALADTDFALHQDSGDAVALYLQGLARIEMGQKERGEAEILTAKAAKLEVVDFIAKWGLAP